MKRKECDDLFPLKVKSEVWIVFGYFGTMMSVFYTKKEAEIEAWKCGGTAKKARIKLIKE